MYEKMEEKVFNDLGDILIFFFCTFPNRYQMAL